jgi:hypothetical protein
MPEETSQPIPILQQAPTQPELQPTPQTGLQTTTTPTGQVLSVPTTSTELSTSPQHKHTGSDTPRVSYDDLTDKPSALDIITDHGDLTGLGDDDHPQYVHDTGDEGIDGVKTFGSFPITPSAAPTTDYQVTNKKYVDDSIAGGATILIVAGSDSFASAPTPATESSSVYIQKKAIRILYDGTYTVSFGLAGITAHPGYGRIYKNGVAYGTERTSGSDDLHYDTFTENLAFVDGDGVALWIHCDGSNNAFYRDFEVTINAASVLLDT